MKAFSKALASLPNSRPIFKINSGWYLNDVSLECVDKIFYVLDEPNILNLSSEEQDLYLAKEHWSERWDSGNRVFKTDFDSSKSSLKSSIQRELSRFLLKHLTQKNPKTTKAYKFIDSAQYYMNNDEEAAEAFYSLYKYMHFKGCLLLEGTNIHVQNTLKIIEVLRHRFEKE